MARAGRVVLVAATLAALAVVALQVALPRLVSRRLDGAIAEAPGVSGGMSRVTVCLPCGSYTVHDLSLRSGTGSEGSPLLSAREMEVGLRMGALLRGRRVGEIVLREPLLHVDVGREAEGGRTALDVPWPEVGRRLLPWPIERVAVHDGALRVHHEGLEEPVVWKLEAIEGEARQLGDEPGAPPRLEAHGDAFGSGRFDVQVDFDAPRGGGFDLAGSFREVPLQAMRDLIEQRVGIGIEAGLLGAEFRIEGSKTGWEGRIDCELAQLDVFALHDLSDGPLHALTDALAGGVAGIASLGREGPLRVRLDVERKLGKEGAVDAWGSLGLLVREALLVPFTLPLDVLASAVERLAPEQEEGPPEEDAANAADGD